MIGLEEARALVLRDAVPLPAERVSLSDAGGRILAEEVVAVRTLPPDDNSAMDGYALRAGDTVSPPASLRVVGVIAAGERAARALAEGEAYRIFTGAAVPEGADAVVMQEKTRRDGEVVQVLEAVTVGSHVRPRGDDVRAGEPVARAGTVLGPVEVAALASQGRTLPQVHRRPRVAVFSSGDELRAPDQPLDDGAIVDSNTLALAAACREAGAEPVVLGSARDTPEAIGALVDAARGADVLVSSGGVSVGDYDHVQDVLVARGFEKRFWKVAVKPGKPVLFGTLGTQRVFGLPGNPMSAITTFEVLVRPLLRLLQGDLRPFRPTVRARLTAPAPATRGRTNLLWVSLAWTDGGWTATPLPKQASHRLSASVGGEGLLAVPADTPASEGDGVEVSVVRAARS